MVTLDAAIATGSGCRRTGNTVDGVEAVSVSSFHNPSAACIGHITRVMHTAVLAVTTLCYVQYRRHHGLYCGSQHNGVPLRRFPR